MTSASFTRMASVTASTKRPPAISAGGVRGAAVTELTGVRCLPLATVSAELGARLKLNAPFESKSTVVDGALDIREGDTLVVDGVSYAVQAVEEYPWPPWATGAFRRLVVKELKGQ